MPKFSQGKSYREQFNDLPFPGEDLDFDPSQEPLQPASIPSSDDTPVSSPTVHKDTTTAGAYITRDNYHWGSTIGASYGPITFGFRTSAPTYTVSGEDVIGTFTAMSSAEQAAARAALALWSLVANITFTDLGNSNSATIEFGNYYSSTDNSEAFAFYPQQNGPGNTSATSSQGDVFVNTYYASTTNDNPGTYEFMTFIHEIGHALGLEHPGSYNAGPGQTITYANNAEYVEDSRMYSLMSYFSETNTGGSFTAYDEAPMIDDIAALQRLYGANTSTRNTSTVYGFNSNAGSPYLISSASQHVTYAIWDGGGTDKLDFSGYSQSATINLNAESFSSVGGDTYNVSIAKGVVIENATGGSGNDTIIGNSANNVIDGGGGTDTVYFTGTKSQHLVTRNADGSLNVFDTRGAGFDGTDTLSNVEYLKFDDGTYSASSLISWQIAGVGDFNGDSKGDILGRDLSGDLAIWLMNSQNSTGGGYTNFVPGPSWQIVGAADFSGDGKSDILGRDGSGNLAVWLMNGQNVTGGGYTNFNPGLTWQIAGTGDFSGDGKSDLLGRDTSGNLAVWVMNGQNATGGGYTNFTPGMSWQIAGVGDFNGDGKSDILGRDTSGNLAVWLMNGQNVIGGGYTNFVPGTSWQIAGVGDFDGDGKSDILGRDSSGNLAVWLMNGQNATGGGYTNFNPGLSWQISGVGDFSGDHKSDILGRDSSGNLAVWVMNGQNATGGGYTNINLGQA